MLERGRAAATQEDRRKGSRSRKGMPLLHMRGPNHPGWKGGTSDRPEKGQTEYAVG